MCHKEGGFRLIKVQSIKVIHLNGSISDAIALKYMKQMRSKSFIEAKRMGHTILVQGRVLRKSQMQRIKPTTDKHDLRDVKLQGM